MICFSHTSRVYAAPCYGTRMPQKKQVFMGVQSYSVLKRNLEKDYGELKSQQEFLLLSYGVFDWFSIDLKGGLGDLRQRNRTGSDLNYSAYLGGGYGFRLRVFNARKVKAVLGFQHISIHPHTEDVDNAKHKAVLDDWQFSLLASYDLKFIVPYLGMRWSRMDNIHWIDSSRKREKSRLDKSTGLIVGADIPLSRKLWVNIEGQFLDATAAAASLNFAF